MDTLNGLYLLNGRLHPCPQCGAQVDYGYRAGGMDPDDVEPTAQCSRCDWGY